MPAILDHPPRKVLQEQYDEVVPCRFGHCPAGLVKMVYTNAPKRFGGKMKFQLSEEACGPIVPGYSIDSRITDIALLTKPDEGINKIGCQRRHDET